MEADMIFAPPRLDAVPHELLEHDQRGDGQTDRPEHFFGRRHEGSPGWFGRVPPDR
jgi:hypothetical protein